MRLNYNCCYVYFSSLLYKHIHLKDVKKNICQAVNYHKLILLGIKGSNNRLYAT